MRYLRSLAIEPLLPNGCATASSLAPMPDFWSSCGYRLLAATPAGRLLVTDGFLRDSLLRPELAPLAESSAAESALHERLLAEPRREVSEAAIAALFHGEGVDVPPLFVHQLTQVVLRHILGESADPFEARVAEMLFRPQRVSVLPDGAVMAADLQTVDVYATTGGFGSLGELLAEQRTPTRTIDLDVLSEDN